MPGSCRQEEWPQVATAFLERTERHRIGEFGDLWVDGGSAGPYQRIYGSRTQEGPGNAVGPATAPRQQDLQDGDDDTAEESG